jgi:hypothetical protein
VAKCVVVSSDEEEADGDGDGEKVCVCVWGRLGDGDGASSSSFIVQRFGLVYHAMIAVFYVVVLPAQTKQVFTT